MSRICRAIGKKQRRLSEMVSGGFEGSNDNDKKVTRMKRKKKLQYQDLKDESLSGEERSKIPRIRVKRLKIR